MVKIMHEIGIFTKEDLMNADYRQIKTALVNKGIQPHLNIFYSIEMGLQNRVWNDITLQEKKRSRKLFNNTDNLLFNFLFG